ncbi:MAG TPA: MOSC domain-containing protein [Acidimicrobiia bacterium]|nr:MOSC domain-containing protein [Acidimicrobiia bacterium]
MAGRVHQINVSHGGVPKRPVAAAFVGADGVAGDAQDDTRHHGGPEKAVCLYSLEVIEALRAEGHPIQPGYAGENLTIAGIEWAEVVPGVRLRVGDALLEITAPTTPCYKNAAWFIEGDFTRMHHGLHPGWSRMYARVLEEGRVAAGDPVVLSAMEEAS